MNTTINETSPTVITNKNWTQIRRQSPSPVLGGSTEQDRDKETVSTVMCPLSWSYIWAQSLAGRYSKAKLVKFCSSCSQDPASASSEVQNSELGLPSRLSSPASSTVPKASLWKPVCFWQNWTVFHLWASRIYRRSCLPITRHQSHPKGGRLRFGAVFC